MLNGILLFINLSPFEKYGKNPVEYIVSTRFESAENKCITTDSISKETKEKRNFLPFITVKNSKKANQTY